MTKAPNSRPTKTGVDRRKMLTTGGALIVTVPLAPAFAQVQPPATPAAPAATSPPWIDFA